MPKVLFVCLGNICRSPLAEAIFDDLVKKKGLQDAIESDSAGTGAYHIGEDPDPRSILVAKENNVPINHKARQFSPKDYENFDHIAAMDESNLRNILHTTGYRHEGLFLMREYDDVKDSIEVPDPYWSKADGFQEVFDILMRSNKKFLDYLIKQHKL